MVVGEGNWESAAIGYSSLTARHQFDTAITQFIQHNHTPQPSAVFVFSFYLLMCRFKILSFLVPSIIFCLNNALYKCDENLNCTFVSEETDRTW